MHHWSTALALGVVAALPGNGTGPLRSTPQATHTILAVFAHPDDEVVVAPLLARYAREGVDIYLAIATDGRAGTHPGSTIPAGDSLATVRAGEARCAAERLGIHPPTLLGFPDGELASMENLGALHEKLVRLFADVNPEVVITWGPGGGYGHPDHRMVSDVVTEIFQTGAEGSRRLYYAATPSYDPDQLPAVTSWVANWLRQAMHQTAKQYLPVQIPFPDTDAQTAHSALACHQSQYTPEEVDEIFSLLSRIYDGKVYLRPWLGGAGVVTGLFE
jgi:LmbE family N-acetylglucosaminyl deacetylase